MGAEGYALELGAFAVLASTDPEAIKAAQACFDFIIDTAPLDRPVGDYLSLLDVGSALVLVGKIGSVGSPPRFNW